MKRKHELWQFISNVHAFGVYDAARIARRAGLPLDECLLYLRIQFGARR